MRPITRGVYVLYKEQHHSLSKKREKKIAHVVYIGVAGIALEAKTGIASRLRSHDKSKKDWTHYSFFEVHDNVSREEILELELFLLAIFRHDPRIELENTKKGSKPLWKLKQDDAFPDVKESHKD